MRKTLTLVLGLIASVGLGILVGQYIEQSRRQAKHREMSGKEEQVRKERIRERNKYRHSYSELENQLYRDFVGFRGRHYCGKTKDGKARGGAGLLVAETVDQEIKDDPSKVRHVARFYRYKEEGNLNLGSSEDGITRVASLLLFAENLTGKNRAHPQSGHSIREYNAKKVRRFYCGFRSMKNIGETEDNKAEVAAYLTIAAILNLDDLDDTKTAYCQWRARPYIGGSNDSRSLNSAICTIAYVIKKQGRHIELPHQEELD